MNMQSTVNSVAETQTFAQEFIKKHHSTNVFALVGELGAGKTTFVQAVAKSLGIINTVTSPTFLLLKSYPIPEPNNYRTLVHADMYRITEWNEIETLDLPSIWDNPKNLVLIEWADRIKDYLPSNAQFLYFTHGGGDKRQIAWNDVA